MALKDLVAQTSSLTEEAIEEIVARYVRYDPDAKRIAFTPAAAKLRSRAKVLVYLVALQGWPFVSGDAVAVDAKPAEIEDHVGIQGGTLRPILKELKDRHMIAERGGRYFVHPATLDAVKAELGEGGIFSGEAEATRRKNHLAEAKSAARPEKVTNSTWRGARKKSGNQADQFEKWIDGGFFDRPKTLADVHKRFHKEGMIVPRTSIPSHLLRAVRSHRLVREEALVGGKQVWVYQRPGQ